MARLARGRRGKPLAHRLPWQSLAQVFVEARTPEQPKAGAEHHTNYEYYRVGAFHEVRR